MGGPANARPRLPSTIETVGPPAVLTASADTSGPAVLTVSEAASLLRVSQEEIERLATQQDLPGRLIGTQWRFSRAALFAWLAGKESQPDHSISLVPPPAAQGSGEGKIPPSDSSDEKLAQLPAQKSPLPEPLLSRIRGRGDSPSAASDQAPATGTTQETIGEKPETPTAQEVSLRDQRILLKRRQLTAELGLFYTKGEQEDFTLIPANAI
ncbi:MAG: helix-turn-helix domain-containing protein, partial [Candidatus Binatia bacterium]